MDERRCQPRFHDVSAFFKGFGGLAVLGFGAFFFFRIFGAWWHAVLHNTSCWRVDEKGRKRTPDRKLEKKKTRRKHEIQENIAIV